MTKIKTDRKGGALFGGVVLLLGIIIFTLGINANTWDINTITSNWFIYVGYIIIILDGFWGLYVSYNDEYICKTTEFFIKQRVYFRDIKEVFYSPTWIIKDGNMTISLVSERNNQRKVTRLMTNSFYTLTDLRKVLKVLKDKAPEAKFRVIK